jgi:hypothetical protein
MSGSPRADAGGAVGPDAGGADGAGSTPPGETRAEALERIAGPMCQDHVKVLSRLWILMQLCTLGIVIAGFAVAVIDNADPRVSAGYGFLGVYVSSLCLLAGILGVYVLRKYRTSKWYGVLIGTSFMMSNLMLVNAVVTGTRRECLGSNGTHAAEMAVGALSVFLFCMYGVFTVLLCVWERDIIVDVGSGAVGAVGIELEEAGASGENDLKMV